MKLKKSLCMMLLVFIFNPGTPFAADSSREVQEAVIQQIMNEMREEPLEGWYYPRTKKVVLKAQWDQRSKNLQFTKSNAAQLDASLGLANMPVYEKDQIINARNLALASISAGGIIYFIPQTNTIFWERNDEAQDLTEQLRQERLWTNPILGNLLSNFLAHAQKELEHKNANTKKPSRLRSFLMLVLNPSAAFARNANKVVQRNYFTSGSTDIVTHSPAQTAPKPQWDQRDRTNYIGLQFTIRF